MSRDIKFKAWMKEKNIMVEVSKINFIFNKVEYIVNKIKKLVYTQSDKLEKFILMQYTGIKDKNGKEIYEGDIVKPIHTGILLPVEELEKLEKFVGVVEYSYGQFILVQKRKTKKDTEELEIESEEFNEIRLFSDVYNLEVIGNIYENPELLGG